MFYQQGFTFFPEGEERGVVSFCLAQPGSGLFNSLVMVIQGMFPEIDLLLSHPASQFFKLRHHNLDTRYVGRQLQHKIHNCIAS